MLRSILDDDYALCLSPGFFCFYAEMGIVNALRSVNLLHVTHLSGSSAGALVASFLAAGAEPSEMVSALMSVKRADIWDLGGFGGLLKGELFQKVLDKHLPVKTFEECVIPLGVTGWSVFGMKTRCINRGPLGKAIRASCCFPGLFAPVVVDNESLIDGGVFDDGGLMALPGLPSSNLVVNIVCGRGRIESSVLPSEYKDARLLTIVLDNMPQVHPFSMETTGPEAYRIAFQATLQALDSAHIQQTHRDHWLVYVDGAQVKSSTAKEIAVSVDGVRGGKVSGGGFSDLGKMKCNERGDLKMEGGNGDELKKHPLRMDEGMDGSDHSTNIAPTTAISDPKRRKLR